MDNCRQLYESMVDMVWTGVRCVSKVHIFGTVAMHQD